MNLDERISEKLSQANRVKISATISEKVNNLLERAANEFDHATKELLIEIALEDFLEDCEGVPIEDDNESLFSNK